MAFAASDMLFTILETAAAFPIILGNVLVILAIRRTPRLQTNTNQFVISLAVADLCVGLGTPLHAGFYVVDAMRISKYVCLARVALAITSCGTSILNLLLISVDRYIAVFQPLHYPSVITRGRVVVMILVTWLYAGFQGFLVFYFEEWDVNDECALMFSVNRLYLLLMGTTQFTIILLTMFILYVRILSVAYRHAVQIHTGVVASIPGYLHKPSRGLETGDDLPGKKNGLNTSDTKRAHTTHSLQQSNKISLKELKSTKTLVLVLGVFTLCWSPYFLSCALASFYVHVPRMVGKVTLLLGILNSTLNPAIYAWRNRDFRRAFKQILGCWKLDEDDNVSNTISLTQD